MVVGMSLYSQIREAYISGESQRSIAKRLGVSRPTVKKYCEGAIMPGVRKEYLRAPSVVTPQVENFIRMCLETDKKEGIRKQSHTAKRIYDRLVSEKGFAGSYSIVRRVVHEMKAQYVPAQADMPLEYDPGDAIQIDWGEATVYLRGGAEDHPDLLRQALLQLRYLCHGLPEPECGKLSGGPAADV